MIKLLSSALPSVVGALLASQVLATAPARAEPALWKITDADSTLYLFGTMHLAREDAVTRSKAVSDALAASGELWLEIDIPEDPAALQAQLAPLLLELGLDPARPLSSKLTPEDNRRLKAAVTKLGGDAAMLEPMRPWLAGFTLSGLQSAAAGYEAGKGADTLLSKAARRRGVSISALETVEQQMRFLAGMTPEAELQSFRETLDNLEEGPRLMQGMEAEWASGDAEGLWALVGEDFKREQPAAYEVLVAGRNRAWADRLEAELGESGTDFVAVGALHLVGPDSVQALLARKGYRAVRVNPARP